MPKRYLRLPDGSLVEWKGGSGKSGGIGREEFKAAVEGLSEAIDDLEKKIPTEVGGMTKAQISALDGMFRIASFTKDPTAEYTAFKVAFGIEGGGES